MVSNEIGIIVHYNMSIEKSANIFKILVNDGILLRVSVSYRAVFLQQNNRHSLGCAYGVV